MALGRPARSLPGVIIQLCLRAASVFTVGVIVLLGVWVLVPTLVLGWSATAIETGSMSPTITRGDIVLLRDRPSGALREGTVVRFQLPGQASSTVHRIERVDTKRQAYVTRGDANPTSDSTEVPYEAVNGVGALLIPMLGYPLLWIRDGSVIALVLLAVGLTSVLIPGLQPLPNEPDEPNGVPA